jgi:hypothetical protein
LTANRSIQGVCSTNCIPAVFGSNPVTSGIVTANETTEASSASQRTSGARSSRPIAIRISPETIGIQIARLR